VSGHGGYARVSDARRAGAVSETWALLRAVVVTRRHYGRCYGAVSGTQRRCGRCQTRGFLTERAVSGHEGYARVSSGK
jgi:hypothetical protein